MGNWITSKTHRYISIRTMPSKYWLDKFHKHEPKALKKFNEHYNMYFDFYKNLLEYITGNSYDKYYTREYMLGTMDATIEEIHELTGILIAKSGKTLTYCIPKTPENDKIYDYILENCPVTHKVLKRTNGTYMDHGVTNFYRNMAKTPSDMKDMFNPRRKKIKNIFNEK